MECLLRTGMVKRGKGKLMTSSVTREHSEPLDVGKTKKNIVSLLTEHIAPEHERK